MRLQMDDRLRKLERRWKQEPSDISAHAEYLSALLRIGTIKFDRIISAALWGHAACIEVLKGEYYKSDAIIYNEKRISLLELRDVIKGSRHLPVDATRYAALGIIKMCYDSLTETKKIRAGEIISPAYTPKLVHLGTAIVYIEALLEGKTNNEETWEKINKIDTYSGVFRPQRRSSSLEGIIYSGCVGIITKNYCNKMPLAAVAWFTDDEIYKAVRAELYPWALGDAR